MRTEDGASEAWLLPDREPWQGRRVTDDAELTLTKTAKNDRSIQTDGTNRKREAGSGAGTRGRTRRCHCPHEMHGPAERGATGAATACAPLCTTAGRAAKCQAYAEQTPRGRATCSPHGGDNLGLAGQRARSPWQLRLQQGTETPVPRWMAAEPTSPAHPGVPPARERE